jgi:hypothetical protein
LIRVRQTARLTVAALVTGGLILGGTTAAAAAQSAPDRHAAPTTQPAWGHPTTLGVHPRYDHRVPGSQNIGVSGERADVTSTNWAGLAEVGTNYTGVSASWTVPTIQASVVQTVSSSWIGIDGYSNSNLIQTGTEQDTLSGGATNYYAWWEILPAPETEIGGVNPGDQMAANIFHVSGNTWKIEISDLTSSQSFSQNFTYNGQADSAEWIEEMTSVSPPPQPPLANFGTANFTNLSFTTTNPANNAPTPIRMLDSAPPHETTAYPTMQDASDLTVTYGPATSTQTSLTPPPNPTSVTIGTSVTYSATVTADTGGTTPSGSVMFSSGTTQLCTATLSNGSGSCSSSAAPAGNDTIFGIYSGESGLSASTGSSSLIVSKAPSETSTNTSLGPVTQNSAVTYTANVTTNVTGLPTPSGFVTFKAGSTALCVVQLSSNGGGFCTSSSAPAGNDTITGTYSGDAVFLGSSASTSLVVNNPPPPPPPPTHGYWLVGSDGGIFTFGSAQFYGSTGALRLQRPVVGIVPTASRGGYWLDASDGGIFAFGDAGFYGSIPGLGLHPAGSGAPNSLNAPIVGMVPSADGHGYFMVASDGGVFAFGDARFAGSCPGIGGCAGAAVAVMPDASGNGYWLVTQSGHVYTFGDAPYYGAPGPQSSPVTSAVRTPDGHGYWILFADGNIADYGDAGNFGSPAGQMGGLDPASAIFTTADGGGYWVAAANGAVANYGNAPNDGSMLGTSLNGSIIAATGW